MSRKREASSVTGQGEFNLLTEPWIPVLWRDGTFGRAGIRQTLAEAARIRDIASSSPMDRVAFVRFLLALLYWCKGAPADQAEKDRALADGGIPEDWLARLQEKSDCFALLGPGRRFNQDPAYRASEPKHTTHYLIQEVPSGTNKWHFRHSTDGLDGLCPACCATGLIRLPLFATSAGRGMSPATGKSPGINAKPPLYVLPLGESLLETLLLSWRVCGIPLGTPEWEQPGLRLPSTGEVPLLTGLTWLPRAVWLGEPEEHESACIACGRGERLIRLCVFDGKGSTKGDGRVWRDPFVVYELGRKGETFPMPVGDPLASGGSDASRWARWAAGLVRQYGPLMPKKLVVVGFATVQNDKYVELIEVPFDLSQPHSTGDEVIALFEKWGRAGKDLVRQLRHRSSSGRNVDVQSAINAIIPHTEEEVRARAKELSSGDESAWEDARAAYGKGLRAVASSLAPGATTRALARRRKIMAGRPGAGTDEKKTARKSGKEAGGE